MSKLSLSILASFFALVINAQDLTMTKACDSTISIISGKRSRIYIMSGKKISSEYAFQRLNSIKSSAFEVKQHNKWYRIFTISLCSTAGAFLVAQISASNDIHMASGFIYAGFIGTVFTFVSGTQSSKHYKNAFNLYNREMCIR
jgi:hypothetical protein